MVIHNINTVGPLIVFSAVRLLRHRGAATVLTKSVRNNRQVAAGIMLC